MRDKLEGFGLELDAFPNADRSQAGDDGLDGDAVEVEALAARLDGFGDLLRVGGAQDEGNMARRLFDGFQQGIEGRGREHVHLVDDVDLPFAARWGIAYAADDLFTHVFNAGAACGIELVNIGVGTLGYGLAFLAGAVGLGSGAVFAEQRLRKDSGRGGFARAARAAEQVGMGNLALIDGVLQRALDMFLAYDVGKRRRTVFAVQGFHRRASLYEGRGALEPSNTSIFADARTVKNPSRYFRRTYSSGAPSSERACFARVMRSASVAAATSNSFLPLLREESAALTAPMIAGATETATMPRTMTSK